MVNADAKLIGRFKRVVRKEHNLGGYGEALFIRDEQGAFDNPMIQSMFVLFMAGANYAESLIKAQAEQDDTDD